MDEKEAEGEGKGEGKGEGEDDVEDEGEDIEDEERNEDEDEEEACVGACVCSETLRRTSATRASATCARSPEVHRLVVPIALLRVVAEVGPQAATRDERVRQHWNNDLKQQHVERPPPECCAAVRAIARNIQVRAHEEQNEQDGASRPTHLAERGLRLAVGELRLPMRVLASDHAQRTWSQKLPLLLAEDWPPTTGRLLAASYCWPLSFGHRKLAAECWPPTAAGR